MKINGTPNSHGPAPRRFSAGKPETPAGGKSFGDALRKASETPSDSAPPAPAPAPERAKSSTGPAKRGADEALAAKGQAANAAGESASFADHMDMVKLRLKSGYYNGKNIDEALSDRLTGYFDELA